MGHSLGSTSYPHLEQTRAPGQAWRQGPSTPTAVVCLFLELPSRLARHLLSIISRRMQVTAFRFSRWIFPPAETPVEAAIFAPGIAKAAGAGAGTAGI